ncbi:MAG: ornithine cyclodeaminase family protein [Firmicutes bacterium]|nr:ornithine cyclodeaminase family protein [Bacillota bacterium]
MLYLTEAEVRELLPMERAIELVRAVLTDAGAGRAPVLPRRRVRAGGAVLAVMAAAWRPQEGRSLLGAKVYAASRGGAHFHVLLWDGDTGEPLALVEADRLGQVRTGAASAVATAAMARPESERLFVVGAGYQAETQVEAIARVLPLRRVEVYSRTPARREAFARAMAERLGLEVTAVADPEAAAARADVVVTVTDAADPVLLGRWLRPGCHVNAAGSNRAEHRELDAEAVLRADVVAVDDLEGARLEAGDLLAAERAGWSWERAVPLGEILRGSRPGRPGAEAVTLFESQGIASEDVATAAFVYRQALAAGRGRPVP